MGRGKNPNSLAALRPGPGNGQGRKPNAGATINEWRNSLQDMTLEQVEAIAMDASAPVAKRTAAIDWLKSVGTMDRDATRDICDYTNGKPKQTHEVQQDVIFRASADRAAEADTIANRLKSLLKPSRN